MCLINNTYRVLTRNTLFIQFLACFILCSLWVIKWIQLYQFNAVYFTLMQWANSHYVNSIHAVNIIAFQYAFYSLSIGMSVHSVSVTVDKVMNWIRQMFIFNLLLCDKAPTISTKMNYQQRNKTTAMQVWPLLNHTWCYLTFRQHQLTYNCTDT